MCAVILIMFGRVLFFVFFFFKQKTAYEMRISDWSSDVCSSDLPVAALVQHALEIPQELGNALGPEIGGTAQGFIALVFVVFAGRHRMEIGRASCRERVCQYV